MKTTNYIHPSFAIIVALLLITLVTGYKGCLNPNLTGTTDTSETPDLVGVEVGKTFIISLKSNPTTGYSWQPEFNNEFLELVGSKFVSDSSPDGPPLVGAGGIEIFEFLALKRGSTQISMLYKRPWEEQPIDKHDVMVRILPTTVKPSTVKQVADNMKQLAGQVVVIKGEFRGWDVGGSVLGTPITRSDWGIRDATGTIYVTGSNGGLKSEPKSVDIGKSIVLVAMVKKQADSNVYYLQALEVQVI